MTKTIKLYTVLIALLTLACSESVPALPAQGLMAAVPTAGHKITFKNQCQETVWVGSIGNGGGLGGGGWAMAKGASQTVTVPVGWSGRVWPRTACVFDAAGNCPPGVQCCKTGSCLESDNKTFGLKCGFSGTPPASLVEFTLDAPSGNGPYDTYDTSFVDGWSVPVKMTAVAGSYNPLPDPGIQAPWCKASGCATTPVCPSGNVVPGSPSSCYSPCQLATIAGSPNAAKLCCSCNLVTACTCPATCCAGQYGCTPYHSPAYPTDMVCNPWNKDAARAWDSGSLAYISAVKKACPQVYAWQFDDRAATFNCRKTSGLVNYSVTFCP